MSSWKSAQEWLRENGWVEDHGNLLASIAPRYVNPLFPGAHLSGAKDLNLWSGNLEGTAIMALFAPSPEEVLTRMRTLANAQVVLLQGFLKANDSGNA